MKLPIRLLTIIRQDQNKEKYDEFQQYLEFLCKGLGHADRATGLIDYCKGLMLPIEQKSIEPLAAYSDPYNVQAKHQSLHHFIAKSDWSDQSVLSLVFQGVMPWLSTGNSFIGLLMIAIFLKKESIQLV
ncbi:MAG: transposase [Spirochaetota bacterium]|nr:transposase [Spirochaetota bacterium]